MSGWAIDMAREAVMVIMKVSAPILLLGLVVGVGVSIVQAATQIQEASLSFIPKMVAIFGGIIIFGAWMLRVLTDYSASIFGGLDKLVR